MKTIRLITCNTLSKAHLLKGKLENEGVHCFLTNTNFTSMLPVFNHMQGGGIQIMVRHEDYDTARKIIAHEIEPDNDEIICPNCGSDNIGLGMGNNWIQKIGTVFLSILVMMPFGNMKPRFYCKSCKHQIS